MKTILYLFKPEFENHEGVRPIQIYLLRLVFALTFLFVGTNIWIAIFNHQGEWKPMDAVAFSVWAAYPTLSLLGIIRPLKLLAIIAFEVFYKITWLVLVAWPLWDAGTLEGSPVERMTKDFLWVILPIVAMPWGYSLKGSFAAPPLLMQNTPANLWPTNRLLQCTKVIQAMPSLLRKMQHLDSNEFSEPIRILASRFSGIHC